MSKTRIISGQEAREALIKGVNIIADAVGSTLGPRGSNVTIAKTNYQGQIYDRIVLHDGVSVARAVDIADEAVNQGAQLLAQAAKKQVDAVGDGTTVVMLLAQAIINECMKMVSTGVHPMSLRGKLESITVRLYTELKKMATPINGFEDMKYIATISAEDTELGNLVATTLQNIGKDGVVTVEESKSPETTVDHQVGMQLDRGYYHQYFVTNPERMEAVMEAAYLLITDKPVTTLVELGPFLQEFIKTSKILVIISPEISGDALPLLIQNKIDGKLFTLGIQAPSFGEDQKNILQDIAILTGGKFISEDAGHRFEEITIDDLGFAEYVSSTKSETIIVGGKGDKKEVDKRVASIKKSIEDSDSEFDKERMKARLGKLTSGVSVIRVGGLTEVEMKERRERVLDSVAATRAAIEAGVVPGGEVIFLHLSNFIKEKDPASRILYKALHKPFAKLLSNADLSEPEIAVNMNLAQAKSKKPYNIGVDVLDGQVKDMIKSGIIDPVLVPLHALQNAVSVAIQIVSTGTIIVPEEKK